MSDPVNNNWGSSGPWWSNIIDPHLLSQRQYLNNFPLQSTLLQTPNTYFVPQNNNAAHQTNAPNQVLHLSTNFPSPLSPPMSSDSSIHSYDLPLNMMNRHEDFNKNTEDDADKDKACWSLPVSSPNRSSPNSCARSFEYMQQMLQGGARNFPMHGSFPPDYFSRPSPSPYSQSSEMLQRQYGNGTPTHMLTPVQSPCPMSPMSKTKEKMPRGKNDNKPRGRMTAYAFFVQTCREEHKKKHPDENVVFAEFSKKCAERWKTMLDKEKRRFHEMAEKDKLRYDSEMQNYIPPKGEKRGKKRKHIKDPNAPKRSLSAFFWFCNDERPKVKAINPEYGVGDVAKELGRRWADADPDCKSKYEAMAEKDKARYDREMTAYKKKPKSSAEDDDEEEGEEDDDDEDDE